MFKSIWTHNIEVIMTREIMSTQLIGLATHLNKIINRINGDDFNPSLIQEIKDSLHALDNNSASQDIDKKHFDKLILFSKETVGTMTRLSEYISNLNDIVQDSGEIGTFELGNIKVTINNIKDYSKDLIFL